MDLFGADNSVTPLVHKEKDPPVGMSSAQKGNVEPLTVKKERNYALTDRASKETMDVTSTDGLSPFKATISANAKKRVTLKNSANRKRISLKLGEDKDSDIASSKGSREARLSWGEMPRRLSNV